MAAPLSTLQRIKLYDDRLSAVALPVRSSQPDTKLVLELLFDKRHLLHICDYAFGPLRVPATENSSPANDAGIYWMDEGNFDGTSATGEAIFRLLAPGGKLHAILEAVSPPSPSFHAVLLKRWKDSSSRRDAMEGPQPYTLDMPIAALCPLTTARQFVAEAKEVDLTLLSRDRAPALFLVPMWYPPFSTRPDPATGQPHNSLPCSPLAYFLLRLLLFSQLRCGADAADIVKAPVLRKCGALRGYVDDVLSRLLVDPHRKASKQFPFYLKLVESYVQYYARSAQSLTYFPSSRSLREVDWNVSSTAMQILLQAPASVLLRGCPRPASELHRTPLEDLPSVAALTVLVPILTQLLAVSHASDANRLHVSRTALHGAVGHPSSGSTSVGDASSGIAACILQWPREIYRDCLIALRLALLSFPRVTQCRAAHYESAFRLWLACLTPTTQHPERSVKGAGQHADEYERFVLLRYEAFVYIFGDVLFLLASSNYVSAATPASIEVLQLALRELCDERAGRTLREIAKSLLSPAASPQRRALVHTLTPSFALNWTRSDGSPLLADLGSSEIRFQAAAAVMTIWCKADPALRRTGTAAVGTLDAATSASLMDVATTILAIVPDARAAAEELRRQYESAPAVESALRVTDEPEQEGRTSRSRRSGTLRDGRVSIVAAGSCAVSAEEKQEYFSGKAALSAPRHLRGHLRFATRAAPSAAGSETVLLRSDEVPLLLSISLALDEIVEFVASCLFSRLIPRCHRGHRLWLNSDPDERCSQHRDQQALWTCSSCGIAFCESCKESPRDPSLRSAVLRPMPPKAAGRFACDACRWVFSSDTAVVGYGSDEGPLSTPKRFYCASCASRPFLKMSTRLLASYRFWWNVALLLVVGLALQRLMSTG